MLFRPSIMFLFGLEGVNQDGWKQLCHTLSTATRNTTRRIGSQSEARNMFVASGRSICDVAARSWGLKTGGEVL